MNLEDIKMLRELHQLQQAGIITSDDFNLKKSEILNSQKPVSSDEKIKLLQELHQLAQDGIISQEEFDAKKNEILGISINDFEQYRKEEELKLIPEEPVENEIQSVAKPVQSIAHKNPQKKNSLNGTQIFSIILGVLVLVGASFWFLSKKLNTQHYDENTLKVDSVAAVAAPVEVAQDIEEINKSSDSQQIDNKIENPEEWLAKIFKCGTGGGFCYPEDESKILTERFNDFWMDALQIYGPSNLGESEWPAAKKKYESKWKNIYPLITNEWTPFDRGNGDSPISSVKIKKKSDMEYVVKIDFGSNISTNIVKLVRTGDTYLIDYIKTTSNVFTDNY